MQFGMVHGFGAIGAIAVMWWLFQLLVLGAVVFLVVYAVRSFSKRSYPSVQGQHNDNPSESAKRILDERFARGEISAQEYREMKEELRK